MTPSTVWLALKPSGWACLNEKPPLAEELELRQVPGFDQWYLGKEGPLTAEQVMASLAAADELEIRVGTMEVSRLGAVHRKTDAKEKR